MKVLHWNVWYKEDIKNVLEFIQKVKPDIICLQELTINHPHYNQNIDTPKFLARKLGFRHVFKSAQDTVGQGKKQQYGEAIYSRYPIIKSSFRYLQHPRDPKIQLIDFSKEGRIYLEATVRVGEKNITIATTHLSYVRGFSHTTAKKVESKKLIDILSRKKKSFVFTGDLNALPGSYTVKGIARLLKNAGPAMNKNTWTTKAFSYKGIKTKGLRWRIDYCFVSPDVKIKSAKIMKTKYSDHLPILLELV